MSQALKSPDLISLAAGFTDNTKLPVAATRQLTEQILRQSQLGHSALQYGTAAGNDALREQTSARLARLDHSTGRSSRVPVDQMVITNGSQQFLYLLSEVLCDPGDFVIVEDPTYFVYLSIMQSHGVRARSVPIESDGLSLDHLEQTLRSMTKTGDIKRLKYLYSVTYFQNPTGITTSAAKKKAVLDLLRRFESKAGHPLYYVEDAAYRELSFPGYEPPKSSLSLASHRDRIIYTGTFSKPFATGIRVGYGILPSSLHGPLMNVKGNHDFGTAHLLQVLLWAALESGEYEAQLLKVRKAYARKCRLMIRSIRQSFPDQVRFTEPQGGLCLWATLPGKINTGPKSAFFRASIKAGVLYVPGEFAFADDPGRRRPRTTMRLSFGSASREQIQQGIDRLAQTIHQRLGNG